MAVIASQSPPQGPASDAIAPDRSRASGRLLWVDNLKGLAIVLVVLGHVIGGLNAAGIIPDSSRYDYLHRWIYAFHMPAFFFVAGIFAFRSLRRGPSKLVRDKALALLYPYAIWTVIQWSCHMATARYTNTQPDHWQLLLMFYQPYMNLWFLYGLFLVFVIFAGLAAVRVPSLMMLIVAMVLFAAAHLRVFAFWPLLNRSTEDFIYFAIGAVGADFWISTARKIAPGTAAALVLILFAIMSWLVGQQLDQWRFVSLLPALLGVFALYFAAAAIGQRTGGWMIALLGVMSLEIYLVHGIVSVPTRIVLTRLMHLHSPVLHTLAGVAAGVLIPVGLGILSQRTDFPYLFSWRTRTLSKPGVELQPGAAATA